MDEILDWKETISICAHGRGMVIGIGPHTTRQNHFTVNLHAPSIGCKPFPLPQGLIQ